MNIRMNAMRIDENRRIVVGKVKEVRQGTGAAEGRVVNVVLEGTEYNGTESVLKTLDIPFWNNDTVKRADQVTAAKVAPGAVLAVELYEDGDKITGNRFMYRGRWTYPETAESRERNVIMGVVTSVKTGTSETSGNDYTIVSIPVNVKNEAGETETEWCGISFWNSEKSTVATGAAKVLTEAYGKKARALCVCGELDEHEYEGKISPRYKGFNFILLPR